MVKLRAVPPDPFESEYDTISPKALKVCVRLPRSVSVVDV